jgi:type IV pilus assembly protein PilC
MIESIGGGKNLSQAMAEFPQVFDTVFVSLVKAGENSGRLNEVLRNITDNLKWQDEQAAHTRKLMMYPSFVIVVVIAIVFFLMTYLVPQLLSVVHMMGQELPFHTKVLVALSNFFMEFWYVILSVPILAYTSIRLGVKTQQNFRHKVDSFKLKLPILGLILKKLILARFANYFAIMYASGITVLECARVCESIVGNKAVEEAVRTAGREIADGSRISTAFETTSLFPPLVLRMLRVGENTGALEEALLNVSYFYNRDVKESVERLQTMIEPVMTVTVGLLLAWIMVSILGPVYELISQIKI